METDRLNLQAGAPVQELRSVGIIGMVAGLLLVGEFASFMASGWSAAAFADPSSAMQVLKNGGSMLRLAALFGFTGLAATVLLMSGVASWLRASSPTIASAVLYFSIIGAAGHSLVPLSLWIGVPSFVAMSSDPSLVSGGWTGFNQVLSGAQGIGNFFLGLAMLLGGVGLLRNRIRTPAAGWLGLLAGLLTLATLLAIGTPLMSAAGQLFMPSLLLTIAFRFVAGLELFVASPGGRLTEPARPG